MEIYLINLILVTLIIIFILSNRFKVNTIKEKQKHGLHNLLHLKNLISLTQVHRGLSSAWLNGDNTKKPSLIATEKKIRGVVRTLETAEVLSETSRWQSFTDHWSRLTNKSVNANSNDSFNQHTSLIANLLYLLEDEAERSVLNASHLLELPNIGYVWRELLVTTENIGQSRALGTGVATTQYCSSVDRIRLAFLQKHIVETTNSTLIKLSSLDNTANEHNKLINNAKIKIDAFSNTLKNELIEVRTITINQDVYFELASECMKSLDDIFELQVNQVSELI